MPRSKNKKAKTGIGTAALRAAREGIDRVARERRFEWEREMDAISPLHLSRLSGFEAYRRLR
jgi:hypothetical protein